MKGSPRSRGRSTPQLDPNGLVRKRYPIDVTIAMSNVGGAVEFGTAVAADLPVGFLQVFSAHGYFTASTSSANMINGWTGNVAVGTAPTADNALAGGEVDLIPSTVVTATGGTKVTPRTRGARLGSSGTLDLDNANGSLELNVNLLVADASISGASSVRVQGYVELILAVMP